MHTFEAIQTLSVLDIANGNSEQRNLRELRDGKPLVLDLWHTRCVKCPSVLTKLDGLARQHKEVKFVACALSLCDKPDGPPDDEVGQQDVMELIDDMWDNLTHCYMTADEKAMAKAELGFTAVPFCIVLAADGTLLFKGDASQLDVKGILAKQCNTPQSTLVKAMNKVDLKPLGESNRDHGNRELVFGCDEDF